MLKMKRLQIYISEIELPNIRSVRDLVKIKGDGFSKIALGKYLKKLFTDEYLLIST
jgi:hypothetical protein